MGEEEKKRRARPFFFSFGCRVGDVLQQRSVTSLYIAFLSLSLSFLHGMPSFHLVTLYSQSTGDAFVTYKPACAQDPHLLRVRLLLAAIGYFRSSEDAHLPPSEGLASGAVKSIRLGEQHVVIQQETGECACINDFPSTRRWMALHENSLKGNEVMNNKQKDLQQLL